MKAEQKGVKSVGRLAGNGVASIVPIEHETMGEKVYNDLREMLIAGQFAPGDKLTLRPLAAALGTSPMPVRDALRQLMVDQAIELLANRAFRVPIMSRSGFEELREIRIRVEGMAVEAAAERITEAELKDVRRYCVEFDKECARPRPEPGKLVVLNKQLHFGAYRAARMGYLLQIIEGLWMRIGPVLNLDVRHGSERITKRTPCEHHNRLVEALAAHDPVAARDALAADIRSAGDYILSQGKLVG
jgi:DNA-binding GntR family transcriptional regulator